MEGAMFRKSISLPLLLLACAVPSLGSAPAPEPYRFTAGEEISLGVEEGQIHLHSIRFTESESKMHASVLAACDEGKDQIVEVEITLLDAAGWTVAVLSGKGKVEEDDKAKIKADGKVPTDRQADIEAFQVAVSSQPD
jgi:hypothetical protein